MDCPVRMPPVPLATEAGFLQRSSMHMLPVLIGLI